MDAFAPAPRPTTVITAAMPTRIPSEVRAERAAVRRSWFQARRSAAVHRVTNAVMPSSAGRGQTIVMVTHEPEMAAYTTRAIHFRDGVVERDLRRAA